MFGEQLSAAVRRTNSACCVGLDPHPVLVNATMGGHDAAAVEEFCVGAIDVVADLVPVVKPQVAFFEMLGSPGVAALERVVAYARSAGLVVILDAKRGDIGSTAEAYAHATLADDGPLAADAVTLSPFLGPESMGPFVRYAPKKGLFVLLRTSNSGAEAWQSPIADGIASWVTAKNAEAETYGSVGVVVGATLPREAARWRVQLPKTWFLVPGYGAQGATGADVRDCFNPDGLGALVNSSRAVLFPPKGNDGAQWRDGIRERAVQFRDDIRTAIVTL